MARFQPGLLGNLLFDDDIRPMFIRSGRNRGEVSCVLEGIPFAVVLKANAECVANTVMSAIGKCICSQDPSIDSIKDSAATSSHWIFVPVLRGNDDRTAGTRTTILQPFTILYVFGQLAPDQVLMVTNTTASTDILYHYLRSIALHVRSSTIPANLLFAEAKIRNRISGDSMLDKTPSLMKSVAYLCFGMQLALTCNTVPRLASVVCGFMSRTNTLQPRSEPVTLFCNAELEKRFTDSLVLLSRKLGDNLLGVDDLDLVAKWSLKNHVRVETHFGQTLSDAVKVLGNMETAGVPPVVMCCNDQAAIDLLVLASPQHVRSELWCVSVKLRSSAQHSSNSPTTYDSMTWALVYDWLRVALQVRAELRDSQELKTSVSKVRFVVVSAAAVSSHIFRMVIANVFFPLSTNKDISQQRRHKEKLMYDVIMAFRRQESAAFQSVDHEAIKEHELMGLLNELEDVCPVSTALTGNKGLGVLMPGGLDMLMPTVAERFFAED
eukprot:PhM_4_TR1734/c0_g1_i8/m.86867